MLWFQCSPIKEGKQMLKQKHQRPFESCCQCAAFSWPCFEKGHAGVTETMRPGNVKRVRHDSVLNGLENSLDLLCRSCISDLAVLPLQRDVLCLQPFSVFSPHIHFQNKRRKLLKCCIH